MSEKMSDTQKTIIHIFLIVVQTLLTVIVLIAAYNLKAICKEQLCIKTEINHLKLNQVKILTLLKTEPVVFNNGENTWFEYPER
jgi:hypothetical protein